MYKILNKEQFFQQKNNLGCFCDHELNPIHSLYVKHKLSSKMISIHYIYTYLKELFKEIFFFFQCAMQSVITVIFQSLQID